MLFKGFIYLGGNWVILNCFLPLFFFLLFLGGTAGDEGSLSRLGKGQY